MFGLEKLLSNDSLQKTLFKKLTTSAKANGIGRVLIDLRTEELGYFVVESNGVVVDGNGVPTGEMVHNISLRTLDFYKQFYETNKDKV